MSSKKKRSTVNDAAKANKLTIIPRTQKQKQLLHSLKTYEQVFAFGSAGTGKTYLSTIEACRAFLRGEVKKIVITRPMVSNGGEEYGALPGNLNQKLGPWLVPVTELLEDCLGKQKLADYLKTGEVEIAPLGMMRGRTFRDSFVIVDEAQNIKIDQMEMLLTRTGEGCRLAVCGDLKQSDIGSKSGLGIVLSLIKKNNLPVGVVEFTAEDCVRSEICKLWVNAFESRLE